MNEWQTEWITKRMHDKIIEGVEGIVLYEKKENVYLLEIQSSWYVDRVPVGHAINKTSETDSKSLCIGPGHIIDSPKLNLNGLRYDLTEPMA